MPELTIIVPIYNIENYLSHCIDSILSQTFSDFELILVDDGSIDNSLAICNNYANTDKRIKVIHQANAGVSVARNTGLEKASGKWISFVDGDDWIDSQTYKTAIETAETHKVDIVQWGARLHYLETNTIKDYTFHQGVFSFQKDSINSVNEDNCILCYAVWNKVFRKSILDENGISFPVGVKMGEDSFFCYKYYLYSNIVYSLEESFYHYNKHENSATTVFNTQNNILQTVNTIKILEELIKKQKQISKFEYLIYLKKNEIKYSCLFELKKPDLRLCMELFPELNNTYIHQKQRISFVFKCGYFHLFLLGNLIIKLYRVIILQR